MKTGFHHSPENIQGRALLFVIASFLSGAGSARAALIEVPSVPAQLYTGDAGPGVLHGIDEMRRVGVNAADLPLVMWDLHAHPARPLAEALRPGEQNAPRGRIPSAGSTGEAFPASIARRQAGENAAGAAKKDEPDPELWTVALIGVGLVTYQIRRKSKSGSIRILPLRS